MSVAASVFLSGVLSGCGGALPAATTYSSYDKASILNAVDIALTQGDCSTAVTKIGPLYESVYSDNDVRFRAAAAYACQAKVNFIGNVLALTSGAAGFSASPKEFWRLLAKTYNSRTGSDYVVEGAVLSLDALQAMTRPGTLILPQYQVNAGSNNVGSVFFTDRTDESNFALLFTSFSTIGGILGRYGLADTSTGAPAASPANLSWTAATSFAGASGADGCALAAGMTNFIDSLSALAPIAPASMSSAITTMTTLFSDAINYSCDAGCQGAAVFGNPTYVLKTGWAGNFGAATGCALTAAQCQSNGVPSCSVRLRNRANCAGTVTDVPSCQAAGIVNFLKNSLAGWN